MKKFLLGVGLLLCAALAHAQAAPVLTFTPSTTTGAGSVTTTLTWSTTPAAQSCTASGHASWTGTKAASGTATLPPITLSGTYTLTMSCTWPGDTKATVTWTAPTTNTDGSALAKCASQSTTGPCLHHYNVYRRVGSTDMSGAEITPVNDPNTLTFVYNNLVVGTHNFGVEAVNGDGAKSDLSNIVSKTITATASTSRSVTITVNPKPGAAVASVE